MRLKVGRFFLTYSQGRIPEILDQKAGLVLSVPKVSLTTSKFICLSIISVIVLRHSLTDHGVDVWKRVLKIKMR